MSRSVATLVYSRKIGSVVRKAVLAYCADRASDDGRGIWASKQRIADEIECDRRTVIRTINALISEGILNAVGTKPCRGGSTVEYAINMVAVAALPTTQSSDRESPVTESHQGQGVTLGSDTVSPKPSLNRPISSEAKASSDKRARPKATSAHRLPKDWSPEPLTPGTVAHQIAAAWQPGRIERELSKFRDHWAAASGQSARKHDWQAAWRTWIGNADEFGSRNGRQQRQPNSLRGARPDPSLDMWRQANAELAAERDNPTTDFRTRAALPSFGSG